MSSDAQLEKPLGGVTKMGKVPKMAKVKNKAPADLQITAEQLLREAKERELEIVPAPPKQKVNLLKESFILTLHLCSRSKMKRSSLTTK